MSKVIVIGCSSESRMALEICKQYPKDEILFYENANDVPIAECGLKHTHVEHFKRLKTIEFEFIPKAKHCPKGYERPYKFHR